MGNCKFCGKKTIDNRIYCSKQCIKKYHYFRSSYTELVNNRLNTCKNPECNNKFVSFRGKQFCSLKCRNRYNTLKNKDIRRIKSRKLYRTMLRNDSTLAKSKLVDKKCQTCGIDMHNVPHQRKNCNSCCEKLREVTKEKYQLSRLKERKDSFCWVCGIKINISENSRQKLCLKVSCIREYKRIFALIKKRNLKLKYDDFKQLIEESKKRVCKDCGKSLKGTELGVEARCGTCSKKYHREVYKKGYYSIPEKINMKKLSDKLYRKTFKGNLLHKIDNHKRRTLIAKGKFNLTFSDIEKIIDRDKSCVYCGSTKNLTLDHIIPLKLGGSSQFNNFVLACNKCNASKAHKDVILWCKTKGYEIPQIVQDLLKKQMSQTKILQ